MKKLSEKLLLMITWIGCILLVFSTFSLASTYIKQRNRENYIYAQKWNFNINWVEPSNSFGKSLKSNSELDTLLETCKNYYFTSNLKTQYPFLSWDNFEKVKIYESDKSSENTKNENYALYLSIDNIIVVNPEFFYNETEFSKQSIILHELAHALITSDKNLSEGGLNEPVAENLACTVCNYNNLKYDFGYVDTSYIYLLICNIYGTDNALEAYYNGTLIDKLNSISDDYGKELTEIIFVINNYSNYKDRLKFSYSDLVTMAQDIIVHATVNMANQELDLKHKQYMIDFCSDNLLIKNSYFTSLLSQN